MLNVRHSQTTCKQMSVIESKSAEKSAYIWIVARPFLAKNRWHWAAATQPMFYLHCYWLIDWWGCESSVNRCAWSAANLRFDSFTRDRSRRQAASNTAGYTIQSCIQSITHTWRMLGCLPGRRRLCRSLGRAFAWSRQDRWNVANTRLSAREALRWDVFNDKLVSK